ncbi:hypothetical protein DSO57_1010948 [Entomophthora muscae]|uniref:Uncharacterized protein n=1 Tax=Entomophthora muscae TaxID=34485 RepID=A0ACC2THE4_9FUNG|nr:hypothetical protein DSO57_1010948 [Entomophthora muscae]
MLGVALLSSQATLALLLGVFVSATFINGFNPFLGFLRTIDTYTINSLGDPEHAKVIMFTFYLSASVALIQKSGGAEALALSITRFATTRFRGQWATYITGLVIFIDDPTSCIVVGANMRTVTDRLYLSHEKLAFLVHLMSSPITSLSPVSSWIGFVLGILAPVLSKMKSVKSEEPFVFFLKTIPSRFFPIFAMLLGGIAMATRRDFGPMLTAERRAYHDKVVVESDGTTLDNQFEDPLAPPHDAPRRLINSILPIFTIITLTVVSLLLSGYYSLLDSIARGEKKEITIYSMAGAGNSYDALLYSSFVSCILCMFMYRVQVILGFGVGISTIMYGVKDMVEAMLILVFAWGVGTCFLEMGVDQFVVGALSGTLPSSLVPMLSFILSAIVSFTTGTSWGTMAIMLPLAMPLGDASGKEELLVLTASAVMSGALFGDLCSPISVTTILTCSAVQVPVNKHVNTQLPYAILALVVACFLGYLPLGLGLYPDWAAILIGTSVIVGCFYLFGVPTESTCPSRWETFQGYIGRSPKVVDSSHTSSDDENEDAINLKNVKL